jgi:hypothetical protein
MMKVSTYAPVDGSYQVSRAANWKPRACWMPPSPDQALAW